MPQSHARFEFERGVPRSLASRVVTLCALLKRLFLEDLRDDVWVVLGKARPAHGSEITGKEAEALLDTLELASAAPLQWKKTTARGSSGASTPAPARRFVHVRADLAESVAQRRPALQMPADTYIGPVVCAMPKDLSFASPQHQLAFDNLVRYEEAELAAKFKRMLPVST